MKALRPEPGERYASAEALADDLERFLNDEPIRARRVSTWEHVWRWARHNRPLAAAVAVIALLLITINIAGPLLIGMISLALVNGRPQLLPLKEMLRHFVSYRREVVVRRTAFDLRKAEERAHILEGLKKALDHIDAIVQLIKKSKDVDVARAGLMKKFKLSDIQAEAILNLRLRNLAKLEEMKIKGEQDELNDERDVLEKTLRSAARLKTLIKKEILEDAEAYGDDRRTAIVEREAAHAFDEAQLVSSDKTGDKRRHG